MAKHSATSVALESDAATDVHVGLIGRGIGQSRTPAMHMAEGAAQGLCYRYDLIDAANLDGNPEVSDLLALAVRNGLSGVNVTFPFKQSVIQQLDGLSDAARAVGAVNTVVFSEGRKLGHNTDYWGFKQAFLLNLAGAAKDQVLLLGAGGAGNAVAQALIDIGVGHLAIHDTSLAAAQALMDRLLQHCEAGRVSVVRDLQAATQQAKGIVNATPVGMLSVPGTPLPFGLLRAEHWIADIIYFPLETELLAAARTLGCRVMDGSGMAVFQAVRAFELFTGIKPDPERMRGTFDSFTPPTAGSPGN